MSPSLNDPDSWWQNVVGTVPESKVSKPKEGLNQSSGQIDETSQLVLSCLPDRIDWQLLPSEQSESAPEFPSIGELEAVLPKFVGIINSWLEQPRTEIQRLALGMVLVKPVEDRVAGYKKIATYLPAVKLDPEESSDFSYSINRPRATTTTLDKLIINRLSRWAVVAFRMFRMPMQGVESIKFVDKEKTLCRLELDINTNPEVEKLPKEKLREIFAELVTVAQEIATKGDVK